jgi:hypothetical protein
MNWKHFVLPLSFLAVCPLPAQDIEERAREGLASARLAAAHKAPQVTPAQCSVLLADWQEKSKSERSDSAWNMPLSTEELIRLLGFALACQKEGFERSRAPSAHTRAFSLYAVQFQTYLLFRAENVLRDHRLVQEYLLEPTLTGEK